MRADPNDPHIASHFARERDMTLRERFMAIRDASAAQARHELVAPSALAVSVPSPAPSVKPKQEYDITVDNQQTGQRTPDKIYFNIFPGGKSDHITHITLITLPLPVLNPGLTHCWYCLCV